MHGVKALALYESTFDRLNEEESSMGISIYDYVTDQLIEMACRREEDGRTLYTEYLSVYKKSMEMIDRVIASVDLTEKLHSTLPNIRIFLQFRPKKAIQRVITLPHRSFSEYVLCNGVYYSICPNLKYLEDRKEIVQSLLGIIVFRQMQTAFHTLMVGRCAMLITDHLIEKRPELLTGQLGTQSSEEVKSLKKTFMEFVYLAALLHDVGKLFCSAVINMQYRKITDIDFQTIKFHSGTGGEIFSMIPQLVEFHDIAAGHHRSFDGKTGYPMEFDNAKSPKKVFIDLITICDSLDAATDTLERNYTTAKTFEQVLAELQAGAGRR